MTLIPDYTISSNGLPNILNDKMKKLVQVTNNSTAVARRTDIIYKNKLLTKRGNNIIVDNRYVICTRNDNNNNNINNNNNNNINNNNNSTLTTPMEFYRRHFTRGLDKATKDLYNQRLKDFQTRAKDWTGITFLINWNNT